MLRELIFLQGSPSMQPDQVLDSNHFNIQDIQELLLRRCQEQPMDFPTSLRQLADNVHRHTWFTQRGTSLGQNEVVSTLRGTRPGSPVADVGFNLLMSDILQELQDRLAQDEVLTQNTMDSPIQIPPITWVDDLAIPITTTHPSTLTAMLKIVLQHIHEVFYSRGLQINYDKGKTEIVVMFRGMEADVVRRQFFSSDRETYITTSTATHVISVRAVPSYEHLGVRYQMDSDLNHEIECRGAHARTAFHEVKKQLFTNKALTVATRIQLLHSLIFSKLLYGCGGWYEIPRRTINRLDSIMMRFYRTIVNEGFWKDTRITDEALRATHNLPSFRYLLAVARLRYLYHVVTHTHEYHRQLLLEERTTGKGWLYELENDLEWFRACVDLPLLPETPSSPESWRSFMQWLKDGNIPWKSWIRRASKMHFLREHIAHECRSFHHQAEQVLEAHGAVLHAPIPTDFNAQTHACPECHEVFSTSTGVAVHRAKKHGVHSPLRDYVQSATCPGCLKFMWTTQRVIQHLRYQPNRCFDRIFVNCIPKGYIPVELPAHLKKVKRLPATRQRYGPLLPLPHEKERVTLRARLQECEDHGARLDYWSPVNPALRQLANDRFKQAAEQWLRGDLDREEDLYVLLIEMMIKLPFPEVVQEKCLIWWIEHQMWDDCSDWPVLALQVLEREHQHILKNLSIWILRTERDQLARLVQEAADPHDFDPPRHVQLPHPKKAKRASLVPMHYIEMEQDEIIRCGTTITTGPTTSSTSWQRTLGGTTYYIIHLYSGRRRAEDLQWHIEQMILDHPGHIQVISVDTAVHQMCDVNQADNWQCFWTLADSGYLLALALGPPCETWSAARHEALVDESGGAIAGPRPLRSSGRPWGLDTLLPREYRQLQVGMRLLMRGILLALLTVVRGGAALLEHPAESTKPGRPSIWKLGLIRLLLESGLFGKYTFAQWRFGSPGVKPTSFLYGGLPTLPTIMKRHENHSLEKPSKPLIGKSANGSFQTSAAKEYPGPMCEAMAACFVDQIFTRADSAPVTEPERLPPAVDQFLNLLHLASSEIDERRSFLPDYQGR